MRVFTRKEIIGSLKEKLSAGRCLFGTSAGIGLSARAADEAGVDLIVTHKEAVFGADGREPFVARVGYGGNCNKIMLDMGDRLLAWVKNTPVIVGVGVTEPYRNLYRYADEILAKGYSGVTNFPTCGGWYGDYGKAIHESGTGYTAEIDFIAQCRRKEIFTLAYCYAEDEARQMCAAGADVLAVYIHRTEDESQGWGPAGSTEEALEEAAGLCGIARKENPEAVVLCCGGTVKELSQVREWIDATGADGYLGDELIECRQMERSVTEAVSRFKTLKI